MLGGAACSSVQMLSRASKQSRGDVIAVDDQDSIMLHVASNIRHTLCIKNHKIHNCEWCVCEARTIRYPLTTQTLCVLCVRACVRACVCACVCVCVRARACV